MALVSAMALAPGRVPALASALALQWDWVSVAASALVLGSASAASGLASAVVWEMAWVQR